MLNSTFPEIKGEAQGSWAHFTLTERVPSILDKIMAVNQLDQSCRQAIEELKNEIPYHQLYFPEELSSNPEVDKLWQQEITRTGPKNWLQVSFYWAESYLYFRLQKIIDHHQPGLDPFAAIKNEDVQSNLSFMKKLCDFSAHTDDLSLLCLFTLWGNRSDLSQLHWDKEKTSEIREVKEKMEAKLLVDHTDYLIAQLQSINHLDMILDNAGLELFTDLLLVDYLIRKEMVQQVTLHFKPYPTFVSDALPHDYTYLIGSLEKAEESEFVIRMQQYLDSGQIRFKSTQFWNQPRYLFEAEENIFEGSDLIIAKGDANYRRLLGDYHFPPDYPVIKLGGYLDIPFFAIRTPKSELIAGVESAMVEKVNEKDPEWMINGEWGMIQFCNGVTKTLVI